ASKNYLKDKYNDGSALAYYVNGKNMMLINEESDYLARYLLTMLDKKGPDGKLLLDTLRLTPVGKFVRKTSLDELPQLINVLKGDMSLIGPRPLLVKYLPLYSKEQMRRHDVRPGITGWAQCHGRNAMTWAKKFDLDLWYVDHLSFMTDLKVIVYTIKTVLKKEGINTDNTATAATMEEFNGHN
ncbi:MAG: sugar transferase, partial [Prevotella sp.]